MLVSGPKGSFWRFTHKSEMRHNGDFIMLFFERNGQRDSISILRSDIEKFLQDNPDVSHCSINFDEPADLKTAKRAFDSTVEMIEKRKGW